jgi:rhamnosyltransferase
MKIAIIGTKGIPPSFGGFETFVYELSKRINGTNNISLIIYGEGNQDEIVRDEYEGIKRVIIPRKGRLDVVKNRVEAVRDAVANEKCSIIYLLGYSSAPFISWIDLRKRKVKFIINPDGLEWKRSKYSFTVREYLKYCERVAVNNADLIIVDSKAIGNYILSKYKRKSVYIPYGCNCQQSQYNDIEILRNLGLDKMSYYLVVGRCVPENNILEIVKGFRLSSISKKLLILTNFSDDIYSKKVIQFSNYDKRIILHKPIYEMDKLYILRKNSFGYIHGHSVGGTNPSLVEAMGSGNIVIAHNNEFNREVLGEELGYFFSNEFELKEVLEALEKEKDLDVRRNLIKERACSLYNWDNIAQSYLELFTSMEVHH